MIAIVIGSFVCLLMLIFSLSVGFGFFIVPIIVAELMLLAAVYLMRRAFTSEKEDDSAPPVAWYAKRDEPPPRALERLDDRYARPYRTEPRRRRPVK
ncbi:MAG: hypothetical protein M3Z33_08500 [Actinomycetota bacterium]|nr:hypothetical protein [Actinomycetota bacterium]